MTDRRRSPRYKLISPLRGDALPLQDVIVEARSGVQLTVISRSAHRVDDTLVVHIATPLGKPVSHSVRVVSSTPVVISGVISFRVQLALAVARPLSPSLEERHA